MRDILMPLRFALAQAFFFLLFLSIASLTNTVITGEMFVSFLVASSWLTLLYMCIEILINIKNRE